MCKLINQTNANSHNETMHAKPVHAQMQMTFHNPRFTLTQNDIFHFEGTYFDTYVSQYNHCFSSFGQFGLKIQLKSHNIFATPVSVTEERVITYTDSIIYINRCQSYIYNKLCIIVRIVRL